MEMKPIPFTENELIHTIFTMKTKESSGYDGISNMILKHCKSYKKVLHIYL